MEGEFQDQGQLHQGLEQCLSSRGSQSVQGFISEEQEQDSIKIEYQASEGAIISNQDPEGETSTMVVVKWSDKVEGYVDNIDSLLLSGLYKEQDNSLVTLSGTDPDANMNCFTWSKENNDWIVPEDQYNEEFNNWREPIQNGQFRSQTLKEKINTEETCSKYAGSAKFNGITR